MRVEDASSRADGVAWDRSGRRLRDLHAERYVLVLRPIVVALVLAMVLVTRFATSEGVSFHDYVALVVAGVVGVVAVAATFLAAPLRVASWSAAIDLVLVLWWTLASPEPNVAAIVIVWPLLVLAYFGSPVVALTLSLGSAATLWIASRYLDTWEDAALFPIPVYGLAVAGLLVSFLAAQARRIEHALAAALARDRVAFVLARSIRLADDPADAIDQIASALGRAADADVALVALLEHEDDFVADLAAWQRDEANGFPRSGIDPAVFDSTIRHLVSSGHGAVLERGHVRVLSPSDGALQLAPGGSAVDSSLREVLHRIGVESGVVVSLPVAGRAVGAIVLGAGSEHEWNEATVPLLEQLAPQLAAGLAQTVLVRDQRDALESIDRVDRMRDRLIANVSHELRTPLTTTIGFVETALRDDLDIPAEQRRELLEHARGGGLRLLSLVEDLLALGSTRPESLDLSPEPVDVEDLLVESMRGIEPPPGRSVRLEPCRDAWATIDRNRILQVLGNLVVNAFHHGDGDVSLACASTSETIVIDVIDEGPGVAPEHVSELFLPFARFSSRSDSTGLGLAICRTIVEAHGGSIDYDRIEGERTRFRVRLPAVAGPSAAD